jgi:hypothetical protein
MPQPSDANVFADLRGLERLDPHWAKGLPAYRLVRFAVKDEAL